MSKGLISILAIVLTFYAFLPYIRAIGQEKTQPHVFSWVIWSVTTGITFFAQFVARAGTGAWPTGISGLITCYIAFLAYQKRADCTIDKTDWCFLLAALSALPIWFITSDPLWAVVTLTTVDLLGFGPTIRKAYVFPYGENLTFFSLFVVRNLLAIWAIEHYSLTTVLFPAAVGIACLLLVILVIYRRQYKRS